MLGIGVETRVIHTRMRLVNVFPPARVRPIRHVAQGDFDLIDTGLVSHAAGGGRFDTDSMSGVWSDRVS